MKADMASLAVQVSIQGDWQVSVQLLSDACRFTLSSEGFDRGEVSVALLDDEGISGLNQKYFGKDGPTDVIAFPLYEDGEAPVGDLYLGFEQARRQASELGVPLPEELVRLVVHGTLHILGHTHPEGPDRAESPMYRRQEELLRTFLTSRPG